MKSNRGLCLSLVLSFALVSPGGSAEAPKTCTDASLSQIARAADCLDRHDTGCAKIRTDRVLEREPSCAEALFIKSWILEFVDDRPEKAKPLRERAVTLNPELKDFWEKRGHYIESQLTSQEFSHFDIQFYGAEDRGKAWDAVKYLNDMYDQLGSVFGLFPTTRVPVIIFTTGEFMDAWRAPFIGGFYDRRDGKVRVRVDEVPGGDAEFRHRARHEFTHAFMYLIYPHELPSWISEGVAEFYARSNPSGGFWKEERLEEIRKLCKYKPWLTLDKIQNVIQKKEESPYVIMQAYQESEALVIAISKSRGDSWVPNVMMYLREHGGTFEDAFEAVIGISAATALERLHHDWE